MSDQAHTGTEAGVVSQDVIYASLDALRASARLDLCAYLHAASGHAPQLFLGTPDLSTIEPNEAFALFSALRDALEHEHPGDETMLLGGYLAMGVSTEGSGSRGLHVAGRRDTPLEEQERGILARIAQSIGSVIHHLETGPVHAGSADPEVPFLRTPVRVAVETVQGRAHAEVSVAFGDEIRTGVADGTSPVRAVAAAVLEATDATFKLLDAEEGDLGGERVILILVADQWDRRAMGAELITRERDHLATAAAATLDAASRLSATPL